ncbi:DUF1801 domain-containing protein [Microbulbifer variabilis]|uniref:DUF1801 domain-containing protein n=1 Tax=Microbulbifer variabilis TaxID=266805 RepID=UPI001CFDED28|nr:DUF1801 domain-containing protein [Microbulbifer variabilis]
MSKNISTMTVNEWMAQCDHPRKSDIERLRKIVLSVGKVLEGIKWNAPSFRLIGGDDDRVTFKLQPKNVLQVVLHRGAKSKPIEGFKFTDETGLVDWKAADRGVIHFQDAAKIESHTDKFKELIRQWMSAE